MKQSLARTKPRTILAFVFVVAMLSVMFAVNPQSAQAATSVSQCDSEHNIAGQAIECSYEITNNVNGAVTSSTVTFTHCHGAANDPPTMVCSSNTTTSSDLVTSISQCNFSGDGGGGTMVCTVDVVNNITGTVTPTPATVNQCNGSADGTGMTCDPYPASTSGATVTQCNDSANGGGSSVACTVDSDSTTTSLLSVNVNQCNNSENGGGSTVICRTRITDNITAPDSGGDGTDDSTGGDDDSTGGDDDSDSGGNPQDENDAGGGTPGGGDSSTVTTTSDDGITTNQVTRVPVGSASTGGGSTNGIESANLFVLGSILLAAAGLALTLGWRSGSHVQAP